MFVKLDFSAQARVAQGEDSYARVNLTKISRVDEIQPVLGLSVDPDVDPDKALLKLSTGEMIEIKVPLCAVAILRTAVEGVALHMGKTPDFTNVGQERVSAAYMAHQDDTAQFLDKVLGSESAASQLGL